ncbi:hypothetical protein Vretimale_19535 [Volvox reticuliferus]|uniref:TAFII55 protein conserved region domain-containing protein n=1 Tax=Volvox reticuliferus TaxID=1737510 RepID=A0A8J4GZK2_9CHLO|nr:hypothetical protein Vretimale_19535 [Volvox reticuliferus]
MADGSGVEEQFVLRVLDEALADKLHRILREEITTQGHIELTFSDNNQDGVLTVEGIPYPVKLLNLPTVVEAYKTCCWLGRPVAHCRRDPRAPTASRRHCAMPASGISSRYPKWIRRR